jgi:hypothetical protein
MDTKLERQTATDRAARRTCLVDGCPCKDPRIISTRRVAFFVSWAKAHGETADRSIAADPEWPLLSMSTRTF